jgi:opacity protein-like surface antigen
MKHLTLLLLAAAPFIGYTQNLHADLFAGIATYNGDLQGKRFTIDQSHPAVGIGASYNLTNKFIVRSGFTYGVIEGNDKKNTTAKGIELRNLSFKSAVTELHLGFEYNLFKLEGKSLTPYLFAGVAAYHFNPYTKDVAGNKVFLKPLSTEGQGLAAYPDRKNYKLTQLALPFGGGIKFKLSDDIQVGVELGLRKLFTDYLDDVSSTFVDGAVLQAAKGSQAVELAYRGDEVNPATTYPAEGAQRGNPNRDDWYYFSGIRVSKTLNSSRGGGKDKLGCPQKVF